MLPPVSLLFKSAISCGLEEHVEHTSVDPKYLCAFLLSIKGSREAELPSQQRSLSVRIPSFPLPRWGVVVSKGPASAANVSPVEMQMAMLLSAPPHLWVLNRASGLLPWGEQG